MDPIMQHILFNFVFPVLMNSWYGSVRNKVFGDKMNKYIKPVNQALNTPAWFKNDWTPDQVFYDLANGSH